MKRDFLEGLGLDKDIIDRILDENSRDIGREKARTEQARTDLAAAQQTIADKDSEISTLKAADAEGLQAQLDALQAKYDTDTEQFRTQIADRDYMDAVSAAIADVPFTSKGARSAFISGLREHRLDVQDGKLTGFDDYLAAQKEADPESFASPKPAPFVKSVGAGGPPANESKGAMYARQFNAQYAGAQTAPKE